MNRKITKIPQCRCYLKLHTHTPQHGAAASSVRVRLSALIQPETWAEANSSAGLMGRDKGDSRMESADRSRGVDKAAEKSPRSSLGLSVCASRADYTQLRASQRLPHACHRVENTLCVSRCSLEPARTSVKLKGPLLKINKHYGINSEACKHT